jgi:hypothetical protein
MSLERERRTKKKRYDLDEIKAARENSGSLLANLEVRDLRNTFTDTSN